MESNKDVLFLEIDEKNGIVGEYQRVLYQASILGIDRVLFASVWSDEEDKKRERGAEIFSKIIKTCEILDIRPVSYSVGYSEKMYDDAMIAKTDDRGLVFFSSITSTDTFENYKTINNKANKINKNDMIKILSKQISNLV